MVNQCQRWPYLPCAAIVGDTGGDTGRLKMPERGRPSPCDARPAAFDPLRTLTSWQSGRLPWNERGRDLGVNLGGRDASWGRQKPRGCLDFQPVIGGAVIKKTSCGGLSDLMNSAALWLLRSAASRSIGGSAPSQMQSTLASNPGKCHMPPSIRATTKPCWAARSQTAIAASVESFITMLPSRKKKSSDES